jgi:D-alanyl-lipoteichoic acid acyltransferase DltB (MBOAT superfamily)
MLFNSFVFILAFLPAFLVAYYAAARLSYRLALGVIVVASLVFYGWWNVYYAPLLAFSILVNFALGSSIDRLKEQGRPGAAKAVLVLGITFNLGVLGFFKYADFFIENVNELFGADWALLHVILPLAISFFTFQKITFLVDVWQGIVRRPSFLHFLALVTFFPQLIAGPIVHYNEMVPQFVRYGRDAGALFAGKYENLSVGLMIFVIGLAKKVLLADTAAGYADPIFAAAASGAEVGLLEAWVGTLAFTMQIYFDFSGYSDMAIGAARMAGITLPQNFLSPYKSASVIEFWRRWHMTLSRFLRDYLYIPLGGNRHGPTRRHVNLMATMLLGGLWHGAAWTFVAWGALHGCYLIVNHLWRALGIAPESAALAALGRRAGVVLTLLAVSVAWVFFRAEGFDAALVMLRGLAGLGGDVAFHAETPLIDGMYVWVRLLAMLFLTLCLPSTQELLARFAPAQGFEAAGAGETARSAPAAWLGLALAGGAAAGLFLPGVAYDLAFGGAALAAIGLAFAAGLPQLQARWSPTLPWAGFALALALASFFRLFSDDAAEFIYFQF